MKTVLFTLAMLICFSTVAQTKMYPYRVKDKWGYCDENKKILIEPTWDQTAPFYDGLAMVKKIVNGFYICGYINDKGKEVIPVQFIRANDFEDGNAIVQGRKGYGLINKKGKLLVDTALRVLSYYPKAKLYRAENKSNQSCFIDLQGKELFAYKFGFLGEPSEGLAPARHDTIGWGFINMKGEWAIGPKKEWSFAKPFSEGFGSISFSNGQVGKSDIYINAKGEQAIPEAFGTCGPFINGIASVNYKKYITKDGKAVLTNYNITSDFIGDLAVVRNVDITRRDINVLIDKSGKQITTTGYMGGGFSFWETGPIVKQNQYKYGLIDREGKTIIECKYDKLVYTRRGYLYTYFTDKNYNDHITGYLSETGTEFWEN